MKYADWKQEKDNKELIAKYLKLFKIGLYEEETVEKLPDMEILGEEKELVFYKNEKGYGFYRALEEEGVIYSYDLFLFEELSEAEYNEVVGTTYKNKLNFFGKVIEIFGYVAAGVSMLLFLVGFFGGISIQSSSDYAFYYGLYESGAYLVAAAVFVLIAVVGRYIRCKDIS